jgi:DNA-binding NarL/FixJ family response regulator
MTATAVRILVADDHEIVRQGLKALLETQPGWQVAGEATDGRDAVEKAKRLKPDLVILDVSMPNLNGLEAARQIRKALPDTEVLILTMHDSEQLIREVLEAGARGYVLKSDAGRELVTAVETVREHKPYFTSRVSEIVLDGYLRAGSRADAYNAPRMVRLSAREREIVQLLAEGKSNKEVAVSLHISVKTAETHRTNLMRKLDLHSISEVVRYAIRNNIVEP